MASTTPKKDAADARVFNYRDVVLGKLKGYPQWPAMVRARVPPSLCPRADEEDGAVQVVDPEGVPSTVQDERPSGKRHFCVRFFPAGD